MGEAQEKGLKFQRDQKQSRTSLVSQQLLVSERVMCLAPPHELCHSVGKSNIADFYSSSKRRLLSTVLKSMLMSSEVVYATRLVSVGREAAWKSKNNIKFLESSLPTTLHFLFPHFGFPTSVLTSVVTNSGWI
jgi:hypothetical protein